MDAVNGRRDNSLGRVCHAGGRQSVKLIAAPRRDRNAPPVPVLDLGQYQLSVQQADDYRAAHEAFQQAYGLATRSDTRSPLQLRMKDEARAALVSLARLYGRFIRSREAIRPAASGPGPASAPQDGRADRRPRIAAADQRTVGAGRHLSGAAVR